MVVLALPALADEVTFDFTQQNYSNQEVMNAVKLDNFVTATFDNGSNSIPPKYFTSDNAVRLYGGNTVEISVPTEYKLESIEFSMSVQFQSGYKVEPGNLILSGSDKANWTPPTTTTNSVIFTNGGSSGNSRIKAIKVVYSRAVAETKVSTPEILLDGEAFTDGEKLYKGTITISTLTDGATTSYSINEGANWTEYKGAIDVATLDLGEHSIWAKATKEDLEDSDVAKVSFTVIEKPQAPTYKLVTSMDEIVAGRNYIIAAYTTNCALGDFVDPTKKQARQAVDVTIDNNLIADILPETVSVVTLSNSTAVEGAFDMKVKDGYLYASGSSSSKSNQNYLGVEDTPNDLSAATITIDDNNKVSITFSKATGKTGKYVYYNVTSPRFSAYVANNDNNKGYESLRLFVEVPAAPVIKIDGVNVIEGTGSVKGDEISFAEVEGVEIYYNFTVGAAKAPAKAGDETQDPTTIEKDGMTYTLYTGTPINIKDKSGTLSYFARANGVDSEVKTLSISNPTGIEGVAAEDGAAVWFNLQGVRVAEPQQGIYVRVANGKAAKVVVE